METIKISLRKTYLLSFVLVFGLLLAGCSKDDSPDEPGTGDFDEVIGTYKGKLDTYSGANQIYFDAELVVTKEGKDKVKVAAKAGKEYSNVTPKTFIADFIVSEAIASPTGSVEGQFIYTFKNKTLTVLTKQQSASDIVYHFEGVKQ